MSRSTSRYNARVAEPKWQRIWEERGAFRATRDPAKPKYYVLEMFPYPSGRIHIGHVRNYAMGDVIARYKRARGFNVLHPMGWDAFGLPAENAAMQTGDHPGDWTWANIRAMRGQLKQMGLSIDWDREFATCDVGYYRWQQKLFLDFWKKGFVERRESYVNWDPVDMTVLANEQVIDGRGWRSGAVVERKKLSQWFLKITDKAEDLLAALALDREGVRNFSSGAPLSTDDRNLMLTRTKPDGTGLSLSDLADLLAPFDPLQPHKGGLLDRLGSSVDMAYLADQMIRTGFRRRAFALARMYDETAAGPLIDGLGYEFFGQRTEAAELLIQAITRDQSLDSARFVLLKPYLPQLARGRASSAALAIASGLDDEPTMVIEAWLYGAAGEWIKLSDYDERLASIDVAKPWSPFAAKLRADWRIAFAQARKDPRFAREALDILDDELATNWNVDLFILRAGCGAIIGDDDVFRESAWAAALSLTRRFDRAEKRQYRSSAEELQSTVFRLEGLKSQLKRITSDERRTDEVRRKVDEALGVLKAEIAAS